MDPKILAEHFAENAESWRKILDGSDAATTIEVFGRVEVLSLAWSAFHRGVLAPFGLNYAELSVLGLLRTSQPDGRESLSALRPRVGQSSAGMTRILDKLVDAGWVRREDDADDRRLVFLRLTPAGAALVESAMAALTEAQATRVERLAPGQRDALVSALDALFTALDEPPV